MTTIKDRFLPEMRQAFGYGRALQQLPGGRYAMGRVRYAGDKHPLPRLRRNQTGEHMDGYEPRTGRTGTGPGPERGTFSS